MKWTNQLFTTVISFRIAFFYNLHFHSIKVFYSLTQYRITKSIESLIQIKNSTGILTSNVDLKGRVKGRVIIAISNQFIQCLRLFKKDCKKILWYKRWAGFAGFNRKETIYSSRYNLLKYVRVFWSIHFFSYILFMDWTFIKYFF